MAPPCFLHLAFASTNSTRLASLIFAAQIGHTHTDPQEIKPV
jgi:hypothetical protein